MTRFVSLLMLVVFFCSCSRRKEAVTLLDANIDLDSIRHRGTLSVVTDYNTFSYFVCKDIAVGYQYELIGEYAKHLGVDVELKVCNDYEQNVAMLRAGKVDIIATNLLADTINEGRIHFAIPYGKARVVLVQRTGPSFKSSALQLASDTVSFMANSFYESIAESINDTLTGRSMVLEPIVFYDAEQIIQMVAESEIKQCLCIENVARANRWYYPNIDVSLPLTDEYDMSWAVRNNADSLKRDVDKWLTSFMKTSRFKAIFRKYILDPREHHSDVQKTTADTYKADFEDIIKAQVTDERYNYLLLSSLVYQESHFNPMARSWVGAGGLMQLMPETAKRYGVTNVNDPEQNIRAGVKYLMWIDGRLVKYVPNSRERIKFALAAYNIGLGHIMDAIRLAEKQGMKTDVWDANVEVALLQKANAQFYSDEVVKHGYCRGTETINYVRNIMDRYANYRRAYRKKK